MSTQLCALFTLDFEVSLEDFYATIGQIAGIHSRGRHLDAFGSIT